MGGERRFRDEVLGGLKLFGMITVGLQVLTTLLVLAGAGSLAWRTHVAARPVAIPVAEVPSSIGLPLPYPPTFRDSAAARWKDFIHLQYAVAGRFDAARIPEYLKQLENEGWEVSTVMPAASPAVDYLGPELMRTLPATIPPLESETIIAHGKRAGGYDNPYRVDWSDLFLTRARESDEAWVYILVTCD